MKAFTLVVIVAVTAGASNAIIDPGALINLKAQIGNYLVNKAAAALTAKQNLILSGTKAVLLAKQDLVQKQIPHLFAIKANTINSAVQLKTNLLSNKAAHLGQIVSPGGGHESLIEPSDEPIGPYSPPAEAIPSGGSSAYSESAFPGPDRPHLEDPEVPLTPQGPPPVAGHPPHTCPTCEQSSSGPVQILPYTPPHVQPAPPVRLQVTYRPPTTYGIPLGPQPSFGPPAPLPPPPPPPQLPISYGPPVNYKPASTYGPPAHY